MAWPPKSTKIWCRCAASGKCKGMRSLSCDELSLGIKDKDTLKSTRRQLSARTKGTVVDLDWRRDPELQSTSTR